MRPSTLHPPPSTRFWPALEALPTHAAVLVDWRRELGTEFDAARPFLRPAQAPARYYPCTHRPPCECQHRVIADDPAHIVAVCQCHPPDCPPIRLTPQDRLVLALDTRKLCEAIRAALQFEAATPGQFPGAVRSHRLGTYGPAQSPAILSFPSDEGGLLAELGALCAAVPNPFILLTPTARHHTPAVESALRRHGSIHIPLARFVALAAHAPRPQARERVAEGRVRDPGLEAGFGKLTATAAIKPILAAFDRSLAHQQSTKNHHPPCRVRCASQPSTLNAQPSSQFALRKGGGYWTLTFAGQQAAIKHEKGILYVAWLLANPPKEPIHAIDLAAQVPAIYRRQLGIASTVDDTTGKTVPIAATARPQERSHGLDDLEAARRLHKKQQELEAVLDDDDATEPEKAEALAELEAVYEFQKKHALRSRGNAERLVRAVRVAITRFHKHLAAATDGRGQPHPVLRPFADHLAKYLIAPSARFTGRVGSRVRAGVAGRFTYEPPPGVQWPQ